MWLSLSRNFDIAVDSLKTKVGVDIDPLFVGKARKGPTSTLQC